MQGCEGAGRGGSSPPDSLRLWEVDTHQLSLRKTCCVEKEALIASVQPSSRELAPARPSPSPGGLRPGGSQNSAALGGEEIRTKGQAAPRHGQGFSKLLPLPLLVLQWRLTPSRGGSGRATASHRGHQC